MSDFYQLAPTILEALGQAAAEAKRVADAYHEKLVAADQATRESEHVVEEGKRIFNALRMSALEAPIAKERAEVLGGIAIGAHAAYFCARAYFLSDKPAQVVSMAGVMAAYGSGMVTGAEFSASRLAAERIVDPEARPKGARGRSVAEELRHQADWLIKRL